MRKYVSKHLCISSRPLCYLFQTSSEILQRQIRVYLPGKVQDVPTTGMSWAPIHVGTLDPGLIIHPTLGKWILWLVFINTVSIKSHSSGVITKHSGINLILASSILMKTNMQLIVCVA